MMWGDRDIDPSGNYPCPAKEGRTEFERNGLVSPVQEAPARRHATTRQLAYRGSPSLYAAVALLVFAVALAATLMPARRAPPARPQRR
jgi:ABC-type lipoprotein release transport system permease subunit